MLSCREGLKLANEPFGRLFGDAVGEAAAVQLPHQRERRRLEPRRLGRGVRLIWSTGCTGGARVIVWQGAWRFWWRRGRNGGGAPKAAGQSDGRNGANGALSTILARSSAPIDLSAAGGGSVL